jgi:hypothetical protein
VTPEQERLLLEYVTEGSSTRAANGGKLDRIAAKLDTMRTDFKLHAQNDEARDKEFRAALVGLDERVDRLEGAADATGKHNVEELRAQIKKQDESNTWWTRWGVQALVGAVGALIMFALGVLVVRR